MNTLSFIDAGLTGLFGFAAITYAVHWWFSRNERVFLIVAVLCAVYAAFTWTSWSRWQATTIPEIQTLLDRNITLGLLVYGVLLQFYAHLGNRRDRIFRALVLGVLAFLVVWNQVAPLRGTVIDVQPMPVPGGGTALLPIRTPPGAGLALLYLATQTANAYGFVVARTIWKRDRLGAVLIVLGATAVVASGTLAILIDFAGVRAPYTGALPHAFFVLCMMLFLAREYSARATELRTHRERLEELVATRTRELRDASEAKSQFLAQMSHEIRTPLSVMVLSTQLLQRDPPLDDEQQKRVVDRMLLNGKHLLSLLNDVLEMSKIEAGRAELVEDRFDPGAMLDEIEQMFAVPSAAKGLALTIGRADELPRSLFADGGKVKQIVINLVSNAVKFTKKGSIRVEASATVLDDESVSVAIVVADTGIGIAAADLERMFHPFEQLKAGAQAGGTGLGLAISHTHARLMRGDLTVESELGVGTTFRFRFMARVVGPEPAVGAREAPLLVGAAATHCKVLIVDDLQHNRDVLAELLSQPSFETRTALDGPDALAIHADWSPHVVLMDLRMPEMDGLEAIRRLRAAGSKAAIGVISASALADDEREALAIGADFFMRKPYDERELFERIERALAVRG